MGSTGLINRAFFTLRWSGVQPKLDIAAIAAELANSPSREAMTLLLFEWSKISSWPFEAPTTTAIQAWYTTAPAFSRVAFVHDPKWNRHVAILSALIRVSNGQARSFYPPDYDRAVSWLKQEPAVAKSRDIVLKGS
jgi:hypothetical protein